MVFGSGRIGLGTRIKGKLCCVTLDRQVMHGSGIVLPIGCSRQLSRHDQIQKLGIYQKGYTIA